MSEKRLIASRKLKRCCDSCCHAFKRGDVYYLNRTVFKEDDEIFATDHIRCARCKYQQEKQAIRFTAFNCHHPLTDDIWSYMPGEAVMQPDHTESRICSKWL